MRSMIVCGERLPVAGMEAYGAYSPEATVVKLLIIFDDDQCVNNKNYLFFHMKVAGAQRGKGREICELGSRAAKRSIRSI